MSLTATDQTPLADHHRVVIVGSGFSGLAAAIKLQHRGIPFTVLERGDDVGGTWRDNTYPGCRCDVPSHLYSFSFAPNPNWSELFSPQPEIRAYMREVAERFHLLPKIRFNTSLVEATWNDRAERWALETTTGPLTCNVLVMGNGPLSEPALPDIPGLTSFEGTVMHSARWDDGVELAGRRVAVVGTGASAVQIVPKIQPVVERLDLYQRTPAWVLPHVNRKVSRFEQRLFQRLPIAQKAVRAAIYLGTEILSIALTRFPVLTRPLRRLALVHLRRHVTDPLKRAQLTPSYLPGCKRLLPSEGFYDAVDRSNVDLVTDSIAAVDGQQVVTADGSRREVDVLVLATGFRIVDNPTAGFITGGDGETLARRWDRDGIQAYLGSTVPGFPNLFLLAGPNTGIGHTSLIVMIEAQVRYLIGMLDEMDRRGATSVEVADAPFAAYNREIQTRMSRTVWNTGGCTSWYLDDHGRNPTLWPDFTFRFVRRTRRFDAENYDFRLGSATETSERLNDRSPVAFRDVASCINGHKTDQASPRATAPNR